MTLSPGQTLEAALGTVVGRFPGTAWVAVESPDGQCSLGVIQRGSAGGVCLTAVTANMAR